ncbi:MAG TPA: hypothetical protein PLQ93_01510 [Bacteroidia bacterium]|nr:hypothetical protein [Bacteroidia bacterium]
MKGRTFIQLFCFGFLFMQTFGFAQEIRLNAVLDSSKIRIGEQVKLDIYMQYNATQPSFKVQWPAIGDTLTASVEVISVSTIDTTIPDKNQPAEMLQHQQLLVSVYDSGVYMIPPFRFLVNGDTLKPRFTNPLFIEVHTVPTDSSESRLKDIKPPLLESFNWKWYKSEIIWTGFILLLIGCAILVWYFRSLKEYNPEPEPDKPKIPAHITALASLESIKERQIWKLGQVKEYYSEMSDALRLYIEERYGIPALESTSDEIMQAFKGQVVDQASKDRIKQILMLSDLVKFAKLYPDEAEHLECLQQAFDFVNGTKREEEMELEQDMELQNPES